MELHTVHDNFNDKKYLYPSGQNKGWPTENNIGTTYGTYTYTDICLPGSARHGPGRKEVSNETTIGRRWPIGMLLRCRTKEVL